MAVDQPPAYSVQLPTWLAARLSESGDRELVITRPSALWLTPLALAPYLVAVAARSLVDVRSVQVGLQLLARLLLLVAVALALAMPTLRSPLRGKTIVFVVDVSRSIDEGQLAAAGAVLEEAVAVAQAERDRLPPDDAPRLRFVTYAEQARVRSTELLPSIERHADADLASDHAGALRLAEALVDPDTEGRVVLITDGAGSLAEREGLAAASRELTARGITLHTRNFPPAANGDVLVEAVHLPEELRVGQTFDVVVDLVATWSGSIRLALDRDGAPNPLTPTLDVELRGGRQQVKLPARVTAPGPVVFRARLLTESLDDEQNRWKGNDRAAVVGEVRGRPRVLLASSGDPTAALARALRADHLYVESVGPSQLPDELDALRTYDLVILSDIHSRAVGKAKQQLLARYVQDHGGGLIMVGGERSFGVGGWGGTTIERLLPVRFEGERQREQPTLALVLVIDKSGSMSSEDKLDLVKEAARATARTLDPSDELGVIAFDSRPHVLVRLQPASNRVRIAGDIRRLSAGGGTHALPALRESYLQLAGSRALIKHVILLSDGQSPERGIKSLLGDMRDGDITVSTVGVGAGAGKDLLSRIAQWGRGRYYFSQDGTDVPRIFSRETTEVTRNAITERELFPRVAKNAQVLRGIDFARAPGLRGIVPVRPKSMSETLLRTHTGDPLLVRGRRGLGRTAAFASDAKPRWAAAWIGWSGFAKLWSQIARDTMRQGATLLGGATVHASPSADRGAYRVVVDVDAPGTFANDLEGDVEVIDPALPEGAEGHTHRIPLSLVAPGRYEGEVLDVHIGQRLLRARLFDTSGEPRRLAAEAVAQVSIPYPTELGMDDLARAKARLAALPEGTSEGPIAPVLEAAGDPRGRTRQRPLWPIVLWALVVPALVLDLLLRRVAFGSRRVNV
jgi:Mg-chelatase subunit ChlD